MNDIGNVPVISKELFTELNLIFNVKEQNIFPEFIFKYGLFDCRTGLILNRDGLSSRSQVFPFEQEYNQ